MHNAPLIFDIHRSSTADGPGLRTVIFFKGCNLDCYWCHNPESKSPLPQQAFFTEKCQNCGACSYDPTLCPHGARKQYGTAYTVEQLMEIILKDQAFYIATGGGVTFSGGECMLYPDFLARLGAACQKEGITVAVDTAGNVPFSHFEKVMPYVDLFLYDVKALNPELHRRGTGQDNTLILQNLEKLLLRGQNVLVRTPLIPDYNEKESDAILEFCRERSVACEFLAYHNLGESKKAALQTK